MMFHRYNFVCRQTAPLEAVKKSAHGKLKHAPPLATRLPALVGHALACQPLAGAFFLTLGSGLTRGDRVSRQKLPDCTSATAARSTARLCSAGVLAGVAAVGDHLRRSSTTQRVHL